MVHILGQGDSDANEPAGYLPGQVVKTAQARVSSESPTPISDTLDLLDKTFRKTAGLPAAIVRGENQRYTGKRFFLWKNRENGLKSYVWPERGFIHIEREDGRYKKWTRRDALALAAAIGDQARACKYADERKAAIDFYLVLRDVCIMAKAQGDPTAMTAEEQRALKESVACYTLPGYGNIIPEKKVTFVGSHIVKDAV